MGLEDDPQSCNERFPLLSIEGHVRGYVEAKSTALVAIDWEKLTRDIARPRRSCGRSDCHQALLHNIAHQYIYGKHAHAL
jgi:hypothetical protein